MSDSKPDFAEFAKLLGERQTMLRDALSIGEQAGATVELDQSRVGRVSRMDAMQAQAMAKATAQRMRHELGRIDGALSRLAQGDYGFCLSCDNAIPPRRLLADPAALRCVQCAERAQTR